MQLQPGRLVDGDEYRDGQIRALEAQKRVLEGRIAGLAAILGDLGEQAGGQRLRDVDLQARTEAVRDAEMNLRCKAQAELEDFKFKVDADLRTIERRAGAAVGAIKPDGTTVEIIGALDAVTKLDTYARNLKTRADLAERERDAALKLARDAEAERDKWKASWEENVRGSLQAQNRKPRKARR